MPLAGAAAISHFRRGPSAAPVFLFIGRLDVEKGTALLLRAFSRLRQKVPSAILRIAGDGPERANLERLAGRLGIADATTFLGWLSPRDIEQQLRDPWASVVPSLWAEPLGLVAIEAILRAVPVIASASGGLAEIVEQDVSGLLFPNNDETALAGCLQAVAEAAAFPAHTLTDQVIASRPDLQHGPAHWGSSRNFPGRRSRAGNPPSLTVSNWWRWVPSRS